MGNIEELNIWSDNNLQLFDIKTNILAYRLINILNHPTPSSPVSSLKFFISIIMAFVYGIICSTSQTTLKICDIIIKYVPITILIINIIKPFILNSYALYEVGVYFERITKRKYKTLFLLLSLLLREKVG